jgi:hypothetical protein
MEDILKSSLMTSYGVECLEEENTRLGKKIVTFEEENIKFKKNTLLLEKKAEELYQKLSKNEGIYLILCLIII